MDEKTVSLIIGFFLVGLVFCWVVSKKGYPWWQALFFIPLGYLGLLIVAFMKDLRKPCPNCGTKVKVGTPFCPKCGAKFRWDYSKQQ